MSTLQKFLVGIVVVVAVALFLFTYVLPSGETPAVNEPTTGLSQSDVGKFPEGVQAGDGVIRIYKGTIGAGVNQVAYRNRSGRTQYADLLALTTSGTASTTQTLTAGTSTSSSFDSFSVPTSVKSFLNYNIPTSTPAFTVNNLNGNADVTSGFGSGLIAIPDGAYLHLGFYQSYGNACTGSVCEAATSTNRGFNVDYLLRILQ